MDGPHPVEGPLHHPQARHCPVQLVCLLPLPPVVAQQQLGTRAIGSSSRQSIQRSAAWSLGHGWGNRVIGNRVIGNRNIGHGWWYWVISPGKLKSPFATESSTSSRTAASLSGEIKISGLSTTCRRDSQRSEETSPCEIRLPCRESIAVRGV